jgi:hypothetical protein
MARRSEDEDEIITRSQIRKGVTRFAGGILALVIVGGLLMFAFYYFACANMPAGCH